MNLFSAMHCFRFNYLIWCTTAQNTIYVNWPIVYGPLHVIFFSNNFFLLFKICFFWYLWGVTPWTFVNAWKYPAGPFSPFLPKHRCPLQAAKPARRESNIFWRLPTGQKLESRNNQHVKQCDIISSIAAFPNELQTPASNVFEDFQKGKTPETSS